MLFKHFCLLQSTLIISTNSIVIYFGFIRCLKVNIWHETQENSVFSKMIRQIAQYQKCFFAPRQKFPHIFWCSEKQGETCPMLLPFELQKVFTPNMMQKKFGSHTTSGTNSFRATFWFNGNAYLSPQEQCIEKVNNELHLRQPPR